MKKILLLTVLIIFLQIKAFAYYEVNPETQSTFAEYMNRVNSEIQKNWLAPECIIDGHTKIFFKLDSEGYIIYAKILESSGNKLFDESAIFALQKSEPFGKFPQNSNKNNIAINYSFDSSVINSNDVKNYIDLYSQSVKINDLKTALKYITNAIDTTKQDDRFYFLYSQRADLEKELGMFSEANNDYAKYKELKNVHDIKRVHYVKRYAETNPTPFAYFYLAYCYEQVQNYKEAVSAIDKAISMTELNNQYKRYREQLIEKL